MEWPPRRLVSFLPSGASNFRIDISDGVSHYKGINGEGRRPLIGLPLLVPFLPPPDLHIQPVEYRSNELDKLRGDAA